MQLKWNQIKIFFYRNKSTNELLWFFLVFVSPICCLIYVLERAFAPEQNQFNYALLTYFAILNFFGACSLFSMVFDDQDKVCYFLKLLGLKSSLYYLGEIIYLFYQINKIILLNIFIVFCCSLGNINVRDLEFSRMFSFLFCLAFVLTGQVLFLKALKFESGQAVNLFQILINLPLYFNFGTPQKDKDIPTLPQRIFIKFLYSRQYDGNKNYEDNFHDLTVQFIFYLIIKKTRINFKNFYGHQKKKIYPSNAQNSREPLQSNDIEFRAMVQTDENICFQFKFVTYFNNNKLFLDNLSFKCYYNKINQIIGDQEAGQTIIQLIRQQIEQQKGQIFFGHQDIREVSTKLFDKIFYWSESLGNSLLSHLSIQDILFDFVSVVSSDQNYIKQKIQQALREFKIKSPKRKFFLLSMEEKISLFMAAAWIQNKDILIFECRNKYEDFKNLEAQNRIGLCVIYLSDTYSDIFGDEIIFLKEGKLLAQGDIKTINLKLNIGYNIIIDDDDESSDFYLDQYQTKLSNLQITNQIEIEQGRKTLTIPLGMETEMVIFLQYLESIKRIKFSCEMIELKDVYYREVDELIINPGADERIFNDINSQNVFYRQIKALFLRRFWIDKNRKWQLLSFLIIEYLQTIYFIQIETGQFINKNWWYMYWKIFMQYKQQHYLTQDLKNNNKTFLFEQGLSIYNYWFFNLLFDLITNLLFHVLISILFSISFFMNPESKINFDQLAKLTFINFLFTLWINNCTYIMSLFNSNGGLYLASVVYLIEAIPKEIFNYNPNPLYQRSVILQKLLDKMTNCIVDQEINYLPTIIFTIIIMASMIFKDLYLYEIICFDHWNILNSLDLDQYENNQHEIVGILKQKIKNIIYTEVSSPKEFFQSLKLNGELTLEQHFFIFGLLSGRSDININNIIEKFCIFMDLCKIRNIQLKKVNDQEYRKILLGIILIKIGNTKMILDDPTKGLDSVDKKKCWELILQEKDIVNHPIIILTQSHTEIIRICDRFGFIFSDELKFSAITDSFVGQINDTFLVRFQCESQAQQVNLREILQENYNGLFFTLDFVKYSSVLFVFIYKNRVKIGSFLQFSMLLVNQGKIKQFKIQEGSFGNICKEVDVV